MLSKRGILLTDNIKVLIKKTRFLESESKIDLLFSELESKTDLKHKKWMGCGSYKLNKLKKMSYTLSLNI